MMDENGFGGRSRDGGGLVVGAILIVLGLLFLAGQIMGVNLTRFTWPFFVVLPGLAFFLAMVLGGRGAGPLAIPGSILTTIGLILLYQNTTGHWESWSYAWALIPTAAGVGMMISGTWNDMPRLYERGKRLASIGAILFVLFGAFFELAIGMGGFRYAGQWFWPLLLIAVGVYLLVRRRGSPQGR